MIEFIDNRKSYTGNWSGRCKNTYKPIDFGPNGWMRDLRGGGYDPDLVIDLPLIYDNEEDMEYFTGLGDL